MFRRLLTSTLIVAGACKPSSAPPGATPAPVGGPTGVSSGAPAGRPAAAVRLGPNTMRYVVQRQLRVEQELGGQAPVEMSYRVYVTATVVGPSDSAGYPTIYAVDSAAADSGSYVPPTFNLAAARGLAYRGRLAPTGELQDLHPSDSAAAERLGQMLGNPRDFFPRIPPGGLTPGADWTDTLSTTERRGGGEVRVTAITRSVVAAWEDLAATRALRIEQTSTVTMAGTGEQGGQPFELAGAGTRTGVKYVASDGRFMGGETRDSTAYTVTLLAQGMSVPVRQVLRATVTVLP